MIYDTFMLRDELDMLECRLTELGDFVDYFVISEATVTHGGRRPKQLSYPPNAKRFWKWRRQIRYVQVPDDVMPTDGDPWTREHAQREHCRVGMHGAKVGDTVLHGDLDEIPTRDALRRAIKAAEVCVLQQRITHFAVDWLDPSPWRGTVVAPWAAASGFGFPGLREMRLTAQVIEDGGTSLSKVGTIEQQVNQSDCGCHTAEAVASGAYRKIASGDAYREGWLGNVKLLPVDVDSTWPEYVYKRRCPPSWFRPRE